MHYLLDGRLKSLSTLIICISDVYDAINCEYSGTRGKLPKLKCFSLTVMQDTDSFNSLIVPLLCRMINLKELQLYVLANRFHPNFINGAELYDEFLVCMSQLSKFTFSIRTRIINFRNELILQTNEDVQRSFVGRYNEEVASYVQTNSMGTKGRCHIYSIPYDFEYFYRLDNSFQRGMFQKVRHLTMIDTTAFKHEFFQVISEEFPFLELLRLTNGNPVENKQSVCSLIMFPHLTLLDLKNAHVTYAELFLSKKNMHLQCLMNLAITYQSLTMITNNFTNDARDFNFERLKSLDVSQSFVRSKNFRQYFPFV